MQWSWRHLQSICWYHHSLSWMQNSPVPGFIYFHKAPLRTREPSLNRFPCRRLITPNPIHPQWDPIFRPENFKAEKERENWHGVLRFNGYLSAFLSRLLARTVFISSFFLHFYKNCISLKNEMLTCYKFCDPSSQMQKSHDWPNNVGN